MQDVMALVFTFNIFEFIQSRRLTKLYKFETKTGQFTNNLT